MTHPGNAPARPLAADRPDLPADIRLIVTDMDGTLLDDDGRIPADLWPLLERLRSRGVLFCPASGRQYASLAVQFKDAFDGTVFIAENGAFVVRDGQEISSDLLEPPFVRDVVAAARDLAADGVDIGAVVCGKRTAYVERTDPAFLAEAVKYYALLTPVNDLASVDDDIIKIALFDFGTAEHSTAPALKPFDETHQVVVSGEHWVDVMHTGTGKGAAVRRLQQELGVTPAQTMVFGDYLNDLEMLDAAEWSFAMANAHPQVIGRARYLAGSNNEHGVLHAIARVTGLTP
ncbi:hydrolase [Planomonospora parontospora subsp. parontospora]|uniref:Hydrolase n=2 Tax=Planomonospora parontospora TaxID=58119 RepID=A0AA37BJW5_9ACTN|nr:Cof-type HAD-IIB family hydrolase [Planomonospora parontospora]GGK81744.1 hydrolase [Planomonospora parontospora]GII11026.1 hydrolase [Planomonospora parontospora subsp. parontospora]